ncbi:MAG: hypothetical protein RMH84_05255 [Sulfolobales archaeon]|nr:hypothetical protein [Sulfolobales archaeon]MCX8208168.1 hypothetical protein [Sulfolobales archaeon]MDW8010982.1 hypothetical protein [Sulfolobales archaeon]
MSSKKLVRYRNCDVERIVAVVPRGHRHLRMIVELPDQVIVLSEATVAAIVRAYIDVVTHPTRRAVELVVRRYQSKEVKPAYSECQLVESSSRDEEVQKIWEELASRVERPEK